MFTIQGNADQASITVYEDGEIYTATKEHANYEMIVRTAIDGGKVKHLFNLATVAYDKFNAITQRITINGGTLYYDHDPIEGAFADQVVRFYREGNDFTPLVKFYEKLQSNPNEHSREQLFVWLRNSDFTIDAMGDIVMYKGVHGDGKTFHSVHAGPAIVNNVSLNGKVPQEVGDVVEMPRSGVQHDPSVGCSTGLHASTFDYARDFVGSGGYVLTVKVNPADVVSVPTECDAKKVRVCRYTVAGVTEVELEDALFDEEDEEEYSYDEYNDEDDYDDEESY